MGSRSMDKFGRREGYYGWRDGFGLEDHGDLTPARGTPCVCQHEEAVGRWQDEPIGPVCMSDRALRRCEVCGIVAPEDAIEDVDDVACCAGCEGEGEGEGEGREVAA